MNTKTKNFSALSNSLMLTLAMVLMFAFSGQASAEEVIVDADTIVETTAVEEEAIEEAPVVEEVVTEDESANDELGGIPTTPEMPFEDFDIEVISIQDVPSDQDVPVDQDDPSASEIPIDQDSNVVATIVTPRNEGDIMGPRFAFRVDFTDGYVIDSFKFGIRQGQCGAGGAVVAGNIGGFEKGYKFDGTRFASSFRLTDLSTGNYCFVIRSYDVNGVELSQVATRNFRLVQPITRIDVPATDGEVVSGIIRMIGYYFDGEAINDDEVRWVVVPGTCLNRLPNASGVAGNVLGLQDDYTWTGRRLFVNLDTTTLADGTYCFVFNPLGDGENLTIPNKFEASRARREFVINNTNTPAPNPEVNSGGGGGSLAKVSSSNDEGEVLGESTEVEETDESGSCSTATLTGFVFANRTNDAGQVTLLQGSLNLLEGTDLQLTGEYNADTMAAVMAYQNKYASEILAPWNLSEATGNVYLTTRKHINERLCSDYIEVLPTTLN